LQNNAAAATADDTPAIELDHVSKRFGEVRAVNDVSLRVERGALCGLIGPNGAGKTTAIRILLDIITADEGAVRLFGAPYTRTLSDRIGYLPEERGLYPKMRVDRTLRYFARLRGLTDRRKVDAAIRRWLDRFDLGDRAKDKVEALSKGNQQKIQFLTAILHEPSLLVLDEPFSGLDPVNTELVGQIIRELQSQGTTVLFSTHVMEQAEKICERIVLIARGEKVLDGALDEIKARFARPGYLLEVRGPGAGLRELPFVVGCEVTRRGARTQLTLRLEEGAGFSELARALATRDDVVRLERQEPDLHAIFCEVAGDPDATTPEPAAPVATGGQR